MYIPDKVAYQYNSKYPQAVTSTLWSHFKIIQYHVRLKGLMRFCALRKAMLAKITDQYSGLLKWTKISFEDLSVSVCHCTLYTLHVHKTFFCKFNQFKNILSQSFPTFPKYRSTLYIKELLSKNA